MVSFEHDANFVTDAADIDLHARSLAATVYAKMELKDRQVDNVNWAKQLIKYVLR